MNYPLLPGMVKAYQDSLLEAAKQNHPLKVARASRPQLHERMGMRVGDLLISAGLKLRQRYQPAIQPSPEAFQSSC